MNFKPVALLEILLLIVTSWSFSFIVASSDPVFTVPQYESNFVQKTRAGFTSWFGTNLVSAEEGVWTCPINLNGTHCQEYPYTTCQANCNVTCFQGQRRDFADCREGTCIDPQEGTCAPNTPQALCQESGGAWNPQAASEIPACRPGCCLTSSQASFVTSRACDVLRARTGAPYEFRPVSSELECLSLTRGGDEGACVLAPDDFGLNNCRFGTQDQCRGWSGAFYKGILCSNPSLNTTCVKQDRTACVDGKDEVYWFDSCGNRENIYDSLHRDQSWNNGLLLAKNDSCELGVGGNPLARQASCGNCNYLIGSRCGTPQSNVDVAPSVGEFVCRDLSCTDENGVRHQHGESWCVFQSQIGVRGIAGTNGQRSVDLPGSEHYRLSCANGEITKEACGTFRNGLCVESTTGSGSQAFSEAACRPNQWQLCLAANEKGGAGDTATQVQHVREECEQHSDCYMKSVDLSEGKGTFAFSACLPKYPPGLDTHSDFQGEEAQAICSFGTVTCKYVRVKKLFGGAKEFNRECVQSSGAESMNNFCMSLGDCGASISLAGEYSNAGFRTSSSGGAGPQLSQGYIQALKQLNNPTPGQKVDPLSPNEVSLLFGSLNSIGDPGAGSSDHITSLAMISGLSGVAVAAFLYSSPEVIGTIGAYFGNVYDSVVGAAAATNPSMTYGQAAATYGSEVGSVGLGAYLGAAAGAFIGAAGAAYLLHAFGIDQGLPAAITYAIIGLGAYGGAVVGFNLLGGGGVGLLAMSAGVITIVVVVIIIAIFYFLGIGKKKEISVTFSCLPWQPPLGGAHCDACGAQGMPCSPYACQSLGAACQYIEDSAESHCINAGRGDVAAPLISPNPAVATNDSHYEQISPNGFQLVGAEANGCVSRFSALRIGISTNEQAQCHVANQHTANFDAMIDYFHQQNGRQSNLFRSNHTLAFLIPSQEAIDNELQIDEEFDIDPSEAFTTFFMPDSSGNVNLYVRCTDPSGNKNTAEYAINFCVSPEPDRTAPHISGFTPASPAFVALNATSKTVGFFVNEPAECRWSVEDKTYETMENGASCASGINDYGLAGWPCNVTLPAPIGTNDRAFYFRCSDKPWINATDPLANDSRNTNQQSVAYTLRPTQTPLRITTIRPYNETLFTNGLPLLLNLSVTTSGGASGTGRVCWYRSGDNEIPFFVTGSDRHIQPNLRLFAEGIYNYPIRCRDDAGNEAFGESRFTVAIDDHGPAITRIYSSNNRLTIITNEDALCAFSLQTCAFSFANGTRMEDNGLVHTSPLEGDATYRIICHDVFDNPSACVTVQGGGFS